MKQKILYILSGIPGSGKSTWANLKCAMEPETHRISRDRIRFQLLQSQSAEELSYFSAENEVYAEYVRQLQEEIDKGCPQIIADATHINEKSRRKLLFCLDTKDYKIRIINFDTPLKICLKRNEKRQGFDKVPKKFIVQQHKNKNPISEEEINRGIELITIKGE